MEESPKQEHINTPKGHSKWLSHSFDMYQSGAPAYTSPNQKMRLLEDAITELTALEGGEEARAEMQEQFEAAHGRAFGDVEAARAQFLEENPGSENYVNSEKFETDQILSDTHWLTFRLAETITENHDPRTPEFLEQHYAEHRSFQDAFYNEHELMQFQEVLDALPEHLKAAVTMLKEERDWLATSNLDLYAKNSQLQEKLKRCYDSQRSR